MEIIPVTGALGAEIRGVDVRHLDGDFAAVKAALLEHEVVFFREVNLSEAEHLELGRCFGTPSIYPVPRLMGRTEPTMTVIEDGPESPNQADSWHTDVTWTATPPAYALLHMEVKPEVGGDTLWCSATKAYDLFSPAMQEFLCGLTVTHDNEGFIRRMIEKTGDPNHELVDGLREHYPAVVHPMIRTHPETGKRALIWSRNFIRRINELTDAENDAVLGHLAEHVNDPRLHCRWSWTEGDLAIWDERSTLHRAAGDHWPHRRVVRRCEIDGTRPYFEPGRVSAPIVEQAATGGILLGECPLWSELEQALYWIDIDGHAVHRLDPATGIDEARPIGARPGSCALTGVAGQLLVATEHRLVWLDWASGAIDPWFDLEDPSTGNRCNDGRVDPSGRMVVGTMWPDTGAGKSTGSLYRVDPDGSTQTLLTQLGVPNGLAFDAERGLMYFADTPTQTVLVADYDLDTGERRNARPFLDYNPLPGKPDGACLDADGCYWSASVYGWSVIRVTPGGDIDRRVDLPVEKPTMPAFGGSDLSTLYVTSIGAGGSKPSAGGKDGFTPGDLMAIDVGVQGCSEPMFPRL